MTSTAPVLSFTRTTNGSTVFSGARATTAAIEASARPLAIAAMVQASFFERFAAWTLSWSQRRASSK